MAFVQKKIYHTVLTALAGVGGSLFLIYLGMWQLDRHEWKQEIIQRMQAAPTQKPFSILEVNSKNMKDYEFKRVNVFGKWGVGYNIFLTGRTFNKRVGYNLLGIVKLPNKMNMLVNFGWVGHKQFAGRNIHKADFVGRVRLSHVPGWFEPKHKPEIQEFSSVDIDAIGEAAGLKLVPYYVDFVREDTGRQPFPIANEVRLSESHYGYAMTWFILAFFWTVGFIRLIWVTHQEG